MAISDFNKSKDLSVVSVTGTPTISFAQPISVTSGDDTTTGTGDIVLDWTNISSASDIAIYDSNDNLMDYYVEELDTSNQDAVIEVYNDWVRDGTVQAKIAYGGGPSDQSVADSTVFTKESNLRMAYLFNESSGDLIDRTGNGDDGTVTGATYQDSGLVGHGYSFDGTDDIIKIPDSTNSQISGSYSLETIIFTGSNTSQYERWLMKRSGLESTTNSWADYNYGLTQQDTGIIRSRFIDETETVRTVESSTSLSTNTWYQVTTVYDYSTGDFYLYLNGSEDNVSNVTGTPATDGIQPVYFSDSEFAQDYDNNNHWEGNIDEGRIYAGILGVDDIEAKYDAKKSAPSFFSQSSPTTYGGGDTSSSLLLSYNF